MYFNTSFKTVGCVKIRKEIYNAPFKLVSCANLPGNKNSAVSDLFSAPVIIRQETVLSSDFTP